MRRRHATALLFSAALLHAAGCAQEGFGQGPRAPQPGGSPHSARAEQQAPHGRGAGAQLPPLAAPLDDDHLGRPVSEVYDGDLAIFEDPGRAEAMSIDRVMDVLDVRPGAIVADVGAGSGWFTVRAARRVGPSGKVLAVEINPAYLAHIEARARGERLANVVPVLGTTDDPRLARESVDVVVLLKTYHELQRPLTMARHLFAALRRGGRLAIIDRNGSGGDHGVDSATVVRELGSVGFVPAGEHDFVRSERVDYLLVFTRP
jgi:SAM-dependent methyltransferase